MRAPLVSLLISAAGLAAGCASSPPQEDPPVAATECSDAAIDPLHLTSNKTPAERGDVEIAAILMQRGEPRLMWVNREMYQSLHALDVELRREQRMAACERSQSAMQTLQAQASGAGNGSAVSAQGAGNGSAAAAGTGGGGGGAPALPAVDVTNTDAAAKPSGAPINSMAATAARSTLIRKSSMSLGGGSGNGATMPKIVAGSDNDIVARRLRKAAEQETDPALRAKLWKEYADYRQGIAAK
jgi:hypothetical protein